MKDRAPRPKLLERTDAGVIGIGDVGEIDGDARHGARYRRS